MVELTDYQLKKLTLEYWKKKRNDDFGAESGLAWYVRELLPYELAYAEAQGKLPKKKCGVLVIMFGYSLEPLLQTIVAYQPKEYILLSINESYDNEKSEKINGDDYYSTSGFAPALEQLKQQGLLNTDPKVLPEPMCLTDDDPVAVFRFLRHELLPLLGAEGKRNDRRVVIDITGAKKSMVAGAYLFAAFADVPVSYVDFETYDPKARQPYGYTCHIDELDSPTEKFCLRDWERVQQLYERYSFRTARELLNTQLIPAMNLMLGGTKSLFSKTNIQAAERLERGLDVYELWDMGDHEKAFDMYKKLKPTLVDASKFLLPTAIEKLSGTHRWGRWPHPRPDPSADLATVVQDTLTALGHLEKGDGDINGSFYLDWESLITYCHDEQAKVWRLIEYHRDYRSALLRAAGLNEVLIKARVLFLWVKNRLILASGGNEQVRSQLSEADARSNDRKLAESSNLGKMSDLMENKLYTLAGGRAREELKLNEVPADFSIPPDLLKDIRKISELRNKAVHFCLYFPEIIARKAYEIMKRNLEHYEDCPTLCAERPKIKHDTEATKWADLCAACGVDFLPPLKEKP
jgi:CRISPR-associated protein (Cas_Cas02710)